MNKYIARIRKHLIVGILAGSILLAGCTQQAPTDTGEGAAAYSAEELTAIIQPFVPGEAKLEAPEPLWPGDGPPENQPVQLADLTGDGQPEVIAGYRLSQGNVGVLVLRADSEGWQNVWQKENLSVGIDRLQATDITGNGRNELLIGWIGGASVGVALQILTWNGQGLNDLGSGLGGYHRLEVMDLPGIYGPDGKQELALWCKDTGDAMMVYVVRWDGPAEDTYRAYFPKVVEYYQERVEKEPQAKYYWYYFGDAQLKAGDPAGALESVGHGMELSTTYPEPERFEILLGRALYDLGRHQEAIKVYNNVLEQWDNFSPSDKGTSWMAGILAQIAYYRGEAYLALGDETRARADWQQALDWDQDWDKPTKALQKLDLTVAEKMISDYLAANPVDSGPESPETQKRFRSTAERLMTWAGQQILPGGKKIDLHAIVPENWSEAQGPKVLFTDWTVVGENEPSYPQVHGVYWWANGLLHAQVQLYSVDADLTKTTVLFTLNKRMTRWRSSMTRAPSVAAAHGLCFISGSSARIPGISSGARRQTRYGGTATAGSASPAPAWMNSLSKAIPGWSGTARTVFSTSPIPDRTGISWTPGSWMEMLTG